MNILTTFGDDGGFVIFSGNKPIHTGGDIKIEKKERKTRKNSCREKKQYSIFKELSVFTSDIWWLKFLQQAFEGKLPKGYIVLENTLTYKSSKKATTIELGKPSLFELEKLKQFMWDTTNYKSERDIIPESPHLECNFGISWNKIKASSKKLHIEILNYLDIFRKEHNLTIDDLQLMSTILKSLITSGAFPKDAFVMEKGNLIEIKGVKFDHISRKLLINVNCRPKEIIQGETIIVDTLTDTSLEYEEEIKSNKHIMDSWPIFAKSHLFCS